MSATYQVKGMLMLLYIRLIHACIYMIGRPIKEATLMAKGITK